MKTVRPSNCQTVQLSDRLDAIATVQEILDEIDDELGELERRYRDGMRVDLDMLARYVRQRAHQERKDVP